MKNNEKNFDLEISDIEENLKIDKISESKQNLNNNDLLLNEFDKDLNISDIVNNDNNEIEPGKNIKNLNTFENTSIDKDFSKDLDNFNKINNSNENLNESSMQKINIDNIQLDLTNQNNNIINNNGGKKKSKKIRTKDDLNNTPLPIFECLYCTNEKIVFKHFSNEILSNKYLLQTSVYDINDLNKLILNKRLINKDDKNEKLLNIVIKNTEYIKFYISKEKNILYFKSDIFNNLCQKNEIENHLLFKHKIEDIIVRKKKDFYFKGGINKIPKNSMNNKGLFNSTNSMINNFNGLSGLVEPVQQTIVNNNAKNNFTIGTCSNNSINFNSLSINNNEFNYYCKDNNNMLDCVVEKIEKNDESVNYVDDKDEFMDFFKFDLSRKIAKKDINWEKTYYDIWNPDINSDFDDNDYDEEYNNKNINEENKNKSINMNINNKYLIKKKNINKSMGYIKYNISKNNNLIFTFNKNKEKNTIKNIDNNDKSKNKINNNNTNKSINIKKFSKTNNNKNISKDASNVKNLTKYSTQSIFVNKSHDLNKFSSKFLNIYYNNNNFNINNHIKLFGGMSYLKSLGSTTNSSNNFNKSANFIGKTKQKIKAKKDNTKSLHYISNTKNNNNNSSTNYSIGVSINLKSNSSLKSNGLIDCRNPDKISQFNINEKKIKKNAINYNNNDKKKKNNSLNKNKNNKILNIFNNINIINLNQNRAKSNYNYNSKIKKEIQNSSKSKNKFKNKTKKSSNYSKCKKNNKKKDFNFSTGKQKTKTNKIISRTSNLLFSSNSIFNNNNNDGLYGKSIGHSFGSNENNISESNTTKVFINSFSNINKSNSNINSSNNNYYNNYSPSIKYNKTYYYNKNRKEINNKINDLISMINNKGNNTNEFRCLNKTNSSNFKNKSLKIYNSTTYLDKSKYKNSNFLYSNKSIPYQMNE